MRQGGAKAVAKRPPDVSRAGLEAAALRYLDRFDCSVSRLRRVLGDRVTKAQRAGVERASEAPVIIEELLARYQASGLLDDQRFATRFSERQRDRGASRRVIEQKLRQRGIGAEVLQATSSPAAHSAEGELDAARAYAKRRRLGQHRQPEAREAHRRKDLMAMARAGFDYDTASRVLGDSSHADDEL